MAGSYRQSSYDPKHYEPLGPPLRPYNWMQWTGVGFALVGIAFELAFLAGQAGWIPHVIDSASTGMPFVFLSILLINSRRAPAPDRDPKSRKRQLYLALAGALMVLVLGIAIAIFMKSQGA